MAERDVTEAPGKSGATMGAHHANGVSATLPASLLDVGRRPSLGPDAEDEGAGGRYDVGEELGHGGMGRVRLAFDARLGRRVALKELVAGDDPHALERFERESHITARLAHPSIIPIYDRGHLPGGQPFYVMKLISGRSLRELIDERPGLNERLGLLPMLLAAAEAVAYAHSEGVIHRDLKPHNVLVGDFGETLVIDWGVAKELLARLPLAENRSTDEADRDRARDERLTKRGAVIGTPAYMPPEQALGLDVDERADVYALGAILYQLLAGRSPYENAGAISVIAAVRAGPPPPVREVVSGAPLDLAAIVDRAMAREVTARYPSAAELAGDLRRFMTGQLVSARVYRRTERLARWARRHRLVVAIGAALVVVALLSVQRIVTERDRARTALADLQQRQDDLVLLHAQQVLERDPTAALAWLKRRRVLDDDAAPVRATADAAVGLGAAQQIWPLDGDEVGLQTTPDGAVAIAADRAGGVHCWRDDRVRSSRHDGAVRSLAVSADGQRAISGGADGVARVLDLATCELAHSLGGHGGVVVAVGLDAAAAYTVSGDGVARRWDGLQPTVLARSIAVPRTLALSPDGAWLAVGGSLGNVTLMPTRTGAVRSFAAHTQAIGHLVFTRDGHLISSGDDGAVREWDLASGASRLLGRHDDWIATLDLSPDQSLIATCSGDDTVRVWRRDGGPVRTFIGHTDTVYGVAFSPDGRSLASSARDATVRVWALDGSDVVVLKTDRPAHHVRFIDGGRGLIATTADRIYVWHKLPPLRQRLIGVFGGVNHIAWSPDGRRIAVGGRNGRTLAWDAATGEVVLDVLATEWVMLVVFGDPDHLTIGSDHRVQRWDLAQHRVVQEATSSPDARWPQFDDAGTTVAWMNGQTFGVSVVDLLTGKSHEYGRDVPNVVDYRVSPDGRQLLVGSRDGFIDLWWPGGGRRLASLPSVAMVGFSPDGSRVVVQTGDGGAGWIYDLATGASRALPATAGARHGMAMTSDGRTGVVPVDSDLVVVDLATGAGRRLRGHDRRVGHYAITNDGTIAASLDTAGTLRLWSLTTGRTAQLRGAHHPDGILEFSPDGHRLAAVGVDGQLELWPVSVDGSPARDFRRWLDDVSSVVIDANDSRPLTPAAR